MKSFQIIADIYFWFHNLFVLSMVLLSIKYWNKKRTKVSLFIVIGVVLLAIDLFSGHLMIKYLPPSEISQSTYFNMSSVRSIIGLIGLIVVTISCFFVVFNDSEEE